MSQSPAATLAVIDDTIRQQAHALCPRHFWEDIRFFGPVICLFGFGLHTLLLPYIGLHPPTWLSLIVVIIYITTTVFDGYSTHLCLSLHQQFEEKGYEFPLRESNPLMSDRLTLRQNILSVPTFLSVLGMFYIYFVPAVGIGAALLHIFAGWSNFRSRQWAVYQLDLLTNGRRSHCEK